VSPVDPRVSIGIPVYNGADTLAAALDSLLAQTFADFEVIIADNASTDGTPAICQDYAARDPRIHYHRNAENLGAAGNFNRVLELARGAYFKWFAHDDLLAPQYLERCLRAFDESDESFVLVHPGRRVMAHDGTLLDRDPYLISGRAEDESSYDDLSFPRLMTVCGSRCPIFVFGLMRTEVVRRTRGMGNYIAADLVFVAEMRLRGRFRAVAGDLFFQRLHAPTPDVLARTRHGGDVAWFDPRRRRRWVFSGDAAAGGDEPSDPRRADSPAGQVARSRRAGAARPHPGPPLVRIGWATLAGARLATVVGPVAGADPR
jgi:glycosyltransferase involved in cell wall biosynthesis